MASPIGVPDITRVGGGLLALHATLFSGPLSELFSVLRALLLLDDGGWIAYAVLRKVPARVVHETKGPRARTTKEPREER